MGRCHIGRTIPVPRIHLFHDEGKERAFLDRMGAEYDDDDLCDARTWFFKRRGEMMAVVLLRADACGDDEEDAALLAHEATHVVEDLLATIGEDEPGCEERAYLTQAVTLALLRGHRKWRRNRRTKPSGRGSDADYP